MTQGRRVPGPVPHRCGLRDSGPSPDGRTARRNPVVDMGLWQSMDHSAARLAGYGQQGPRLETIGSIRNTFPSGSAVRGPSQRVVREGSFNDRRRTFRDRIAGFTPERRGRVEAKKAELTAEMPPGDLRQATVVSQMLDADHQDCRDTRGMVAERYGGHHDR